MRKENGACAFRPRANVNTSRPIIANTTRRANKKKSVSNCSYFASRGQNYYYLSHVSHRVSRHLFSFCFASASQCQRNVERPPFNKPTMSHNYCLNFPIDSSSSFAYENTAGTIVTISGDILSENFSFSLAATHWRAHWLASAWTAEKKRSA